MFVDSWWIDVDIPSCLMWWFLLYLALDAPCQSSTTMLGCTHDITKNDMVDIRRMDVYIPSCERVDCL